MRKRRRMGLHEFLMIVFFLSSIYISYSFIKHDILQIDDSFASSRQECYNDGGFEFRQHTGLFIGGHVCIYQRR